MEKVNNAYISVDLEAAQIQPVLEKIQAALGDLGVEAELTESRTHVSIAYMNGECSKTEIEQVAREISEQSLYAQVVGVKIFEGLTTGYDYVALTLADENDFSSTTEKVSGQLPVKKFAGGFKSHVTLFQIQKGVVHHDNVQKINEYLKQKAFTDSVGTKIEGKTVSVYNSNRECQLQYAMRSAC